MGRSTQATTMIAVTIITVEISTVMIIAMMIIAMTIIEAVAMTLPIGRVRETTPLLPIMTLGTTPAQGIGMHIQCCPKRIDTNYLHCK